MCCCNGCAHHSWNCGCGCGCGCSGNGSSCGCGGNGGISTLPSFPDLPVYPSTAGTVSNTRWPVYVSVPAFLWDTAVTEDSCGCGCGCLR